MKISILLIFISAFNLLAKPGYSQSEKISLKLANVNTIGNVISEIERTTDYVFIYNEDVVPTLKKEAKVEMTDQSLNEILNQLIKGTDLAYSVSSKQVTLYKDESKKVYTQIVSSAPLVVQQPSGKTITGTITDISGEPLPGVTVLIKGTSQGTITDVDGKFTLMDISENAILQFSFVGMKSQEIPIGNQTRFDVVMEEDAIGLEEFVAIGYGTMKKRDLIGAVDAVGSEVIGDRSNPNLTRSLQGQVAGLNINFNDGKPSRGGSFNIRGQGSIGAGGSALVLIDGVEGSLNIVNPQDVESISVLKDASSTAVYGARGAFGVILVTTKQAQKGRAVVNYSGSISINRRTVIPDGITDSNEWLDWWKTSYNNYYDGSRALLNHIDSKVPYSEEIYNLIAQRNADIAATGSSDIPAVIESYDVPNFGYAYLANTDWMNEIYRKAHTSTEHNISVSGGTDLTDYYVSGRYYGSQGVYKVGDEDFKKYNLRANGSHKIRPWLKLTNNMSFSTDENYIPMGSTDNPLQRYIQHTISPTAPLRNPDGSWTPASGVSGLAAYYEGNNYLTDDYIYFRNKTSAEIDIFKDILKLQADYSYNYTGRTNTRIRNYVYYSKSPGIFITEGEGSGNGKKETNYDTRYQSVNAYATYTPRLGVNNSFTSLIGYNAEAEGIKVKGDQLYLGFACHNGSGTYRYAEILHYDLNTDN